MKYWGLWLKTGDGGWLRKMDGEALYFPLRSIAEAYRQTMSFYSPNDIEVRRFPEDEA